MNHPHQGKRSGAGVHSSGVPMRVLPRLYLLLAALALPEPTARADLVFLKDGHVLQGKVRREFTAEFAAVSKYLVLMPTGYFMLDDGPRRIYFSPSQVRIVEKMSSPPEDRVLSHRGRLILSPKNMPPIHEVLEVGPWNYDRWEREF